MDETEYEVGKKDLVNTYNREGKLSLFSAYIYYKEKGHNKSNLNYDEFCDIFLKSMGMTAFNTNLQIHVPLVNVESTIQLLVSYYNVKTIIDSNNKLIMTC